VFHSRAVAVFVGEEAKFLMLIWMNFCLAALSGAFFFLLALTGLTMRFLVVVSVL